MSSSRCDRYCGVKDGNFEEYWASVHARQTEWTSGTIITRQFRYSGHGLGVSWLSLEEKTVAEDPGLVSNPSL
jgi:hypothetical protein